jgi:hypothetical protein
MNAARLLGDKEALSLSCNDILFLQVAVVVTKLYLFVVIFL